MLVPLVAAVAIHPCRSPLPRGPAVPAPIVLSTDCGSFRMGRDGNVERLPRHWLARHGGGTGRRWGSQLELRPARDGRMVVRRRGTLVWRSTGFHRSDGGVAFGPHEFAYASYPTGVYLTDLERPERLVVAGRGLYPVGFTRTGELLVAARSTITVVSRDGRILRRYRFSAPSGYAFDAAGDTLFFVTRDDMLAAARGPHLRLVRRLSTPAESMSAVGGLLVFLGARDLEVVRRDGRVLARTTWPTGSSDSGVSVSADGRSYAFRVSSARRSWAAVYVLRAGSERADVAFRGRLGPSGCAVDANLSWHGRFLLYDSTDGTLAVLGHDREAVDLGALARALPHLSPAERATAAWESDFRR